VSKGEPSYEKPDWLTSKETKKGKHKFFGSNFGPKPYPCSPNFEFGRLSVDGTFLIRFEIKLKVVLIILGIFLFDIISG
jgi:hypothetical protein